MTDNQRKSRVATDLEFINSKRFAPTQPITLYDAMARAVAFNLQHSVRQIERDIAKLELEQGNLEALPDLEGDFGYNRDSKVTSVGTDRKITSASIGGTWNLLDLGVSYARAQQSADRVLIAEERRRKGLQDIIRNVRLAYWKAVGAQRLMTRVALIEREFSAGLAESRRLEINNIETRRRTVGFRRGLIDTVRQLIAARKEYGRARLEFAQLINIRPGINFTLQLPASMQGIPALPVAVEEMASFALANRPELRVEDYNERITDWESREALYSMFPGLDLNLTRNLSNDGGVVNSPWTGVGAELGMNLFRLFSGPLRMQAAEQRGELARRQRLALSVAVLAQVHIAFQEYRETSYQFRLARQITHSDRELSKMAMMERTITQGNRLDVIDVAARQLRSEVEQHRAYVELRRAHGDMLHSLGLDIIPDNVPMDDVDGLRIAIRHAVAKWENLSADTDPANDGSIEDLVGQVFADLRGDMMVPGEPVSGTQRDPANAPKYEMQGMIGRAAGPVTAIAALPADLIKPSPARAAPTEPMSPMIAVLDLADMALAMIDDAMTDDAMAAPSPSKAMQPPPAPDLAEIQVAAPLTAPVVASPTVMTPADPKPAMIAALDLADMALAMTDDAMTDDAMAAPSPSKAMQPPPALDLAEIQVAAPLAAPVIASPTVMTPADPKPPVIAALDLADMALAMTDDAMTDDAMATPSPSKAMQPPPAPDVTEFQLAMPSARSALQRPDAEAVTPAAVARAPYPHNDQASEILPPLPRMKRRLPAYDVQFGAFSEQGHAQSLLKELRNSRRRMDANRKFRVVTKIHPDKQALFHVRYGAYLGWTAALKACDAFTRQGRKCVVVRHKIINAAKFKMQAAI